MSTCIIFKILKYPLLHWEEKKTHGKRLMEDKSILKIISRILTSNQDIDWSFKSIIYMIVLTKNY